MIVRKVFRIHVNRLVKLGKINSHRMLIIRINPFKLNNHKVQNKRVPLIYLNRSLLIINSLNSEITELHKVKNLMK